MTLKKETSMSNNKTIKDFLYWMDKNKIDSVIPFLVMMDGKDEKIPHWTNGEKLFTANDLIKWYNEKRARKKVVCYCGSLRVALEAFKKAEYESVLNGEISPASLLYVC